MIRTLCAAAALSATAVAADVPCGPDTPCELPNGDYQVLAPADWDGKTALPTLVFFHGHNSSSKMLYRSAGLRRDFVEQGYLVIAPNGTMRPGSKIRAWPARPSNTGRDDVAFTLAVLKDASTRMAIDPDRVYAGGFSAGGSMAWMMACYAGQEFAGVVSVAGALRRPNPTDRCPAGPVPVLQVHGFADGQVPFEGRQIRDWHQGDVFSSLGLIRETNSCRSNPDNIEIDLSLIHI